ncbi:MAG: DNA polymerase-3 subunit delta' [Paraglaciecola sp.]|jgi:DNA polymerase-3 subunit delta'
MYPWLAHKKQQLCRRIIQGKLHHALLFQGQDGIGKTEFAQDLARFLLCANKQETAACGECQACKLNRAGTHPDFHQIESEKQIGVDQIREAIKKLLGSSQLCGAKVLVIYAAHTMTESSANALLKTLEEPTDNTFLLLITSKPERLLPTILSRCERLLLPGSDMATTSEWLKSQGYTQLDQDLIRLYGASPLNLLKELQAEKSFSYQQFLAGIEGLGNQQCSVAELSSSWQEHTERVIKWLQYWLADQIRQSPAKVEQLWVLHGACARATEALRHPGLNKSLLLANLLQALVLKEAPKTVHKTALKTSFR